jgi:thiol-disulfide isomerase/thioredoxin
MMRIFYILLSFIIFSAAQVTSSASAQAQIQSQVQPELYVVMFRADWCPPCKIVEPNISQALSSLRDSSIEYVTIDISNPNISEISAHYAFDRQIIPQYNRWLGVTGFAAIIDATTKTTLGCVNIQYSPDDMIAHIRNLKTYAVADQAALDFTCPEPNN